MALWRRVFGGGSSSGTAAPETPPAVDPERVSSKDFLELDKIDTEWVYSWGCDVDGRLGSLDSEPQKDASVVPLIVAFPKEIYTNPECKVIFVSAGRRHTACLTADGRIFSWGGNASGELGPPRPGVTSRPNSIPTPAGLVRFLGVSCGDGFTVAHGVLSSGHHAVYSWGDARYRPHHSSFEVCQFQNPVLQVGAGTSHYLILTQDDGLHAFGGSSYGQLGLPPTMGTFVNRVTRVEGKLAAQKIVQIAVGGYHNLVLTDTGVVYAFGAGGYGQLGCGSLPRSVPEPEPVKALLEIGVQANFVACGASHSIVLGRDGKMYLFGRNVDGQCAPPSGTNVVVPRVIEPQGKDGYFMYATAGFGCSKAIQTNGQLLSLGVIWNDSTHEDMTPIAKRCVHQIWCGHYHAVAVVANMPKIFVAQSTHSLDFHRLFAESSLKDICSIKIDGKSDHAGWKAHRWMISILNLLKFSESADSVTLPSSVDPDLFDHILKWYYQFYVCIPAALLPNALSCCQTLGATLMASQIEIQIRASGRRAVSSNPAATTTDPSDVVYLKMDNDDRTKLFGQLLMTGEASNVTLILGQDKSVKAHRSILSCRSPKFKGMLEGSFAESNQAEIDLTALQCDSDSLNRLILYFYTDHAEFDGDSALELLSLASEYMLPHLFTACEKFIAENITEDTACELLRVADLIEATQLRRAILHYLRVRFKSESFPTIPSLDVLSPKQQEEIQSVLPT